MKNSPKRRYKKFGESCEVENLGEGSAAGKTGEGVSGEEKGRKGKEGGTMLRRLPEESLLFLYLKGPLAHC